MISFIIPSYNNLKHLKNVYASIKKHAPQAEVILLNDGSTDGTSEWLQGLPASPDLLIYEQESRVGHTILYDRGIELATNKIVGILHADMIIGPNFVENMIKHLKPLTVVCATRIEPPLHPEGKEKIIKDFGMDFDTLNVPAFEQFVTEKQVEYKDIVTKGMFAPWIIYKEDFQAIGGHDPLFAPFPYEDSDIFQRWMLNDYKLVQSRDAFVYHLTCRGHRWNEQVGKDDEYYKVVSQRAARNYIRKWGSWIKNDEFQCPIIPHKYNVAFVVDNCNLQALEVLEPWCDRIYIEDDMDVIKHAYFEKEQSNTKYELTKRVMTIGWNDPLGENDVVLEFDMKNFTQESFHIIQNLADILTDSGTPNGVFTLDCFRISTCDLHPLEHSLIKL